ncbi:serine hydrolase domain-containing protein [Haloferula sargassicola]|uniref:Uncharacterized protein Rv1367c n=1 Tax=Haloferula sargassicola TaxID=490096 RepID=A0ABP9UMU1_9BACT
MKTLTALMFASSFAAASPTLQPVTKAVDEAIDAWQVAGAVTLVSEDGEIRHLGAQGYADVESKKPMPEDALFWIASMTKPVTAAAVMHQVEAGKIDLEAPVSDYLPAFKDLKGPEGKPATVTLKQCLTHTSGLADLEPGEGAEPTTLEEVIPLIVAKPLNFEPGSQWQYCQTGINTAARVVEVVSGQAFPDYLQQHFFKPLGMDDTSFYPTEDQSKRLATSYAKQENGDLEPAVLRFLYGKPVTSKNRYPLANGGLFSTARDYHRFCRMLLGKGELEGERYLKPESVEMMSSIQTGDLETGFTPGNGWGIGCCVVKEPQGVTAALSPGSFGHGGAYGTQAWIDPVKKRVYLLMVQRANFPNSDGSNLREAFQDAAAEALAHGSESSRDGD